MSLVVSGLLCSLGPVIILQSFFSFRVESHLGYMRLHLYQQRAHGNTLLGCMNGIDRADGRVHVHAGAFGCGVMSLSVRLLRVGFGRSCHSGWSLRRVYGIVQRYIGRSSYTPGVHRELVPMGYMDMCSLLRCSVMYCFSAIGIENLAETQRRGRSLRCAIGPQAVALTATRFR